MDVLYFCEHPVDTGVKGKFMLHAEAVWITFFWCYSPDGKTLVFLSAKSAVDSGAHVATESLHKMDWPADSKPDPSSSIIDVVNLNLNFRFSLQDFLRYCMLWVVPKIIPWIFYIGF